jgi:hypothetical protein
VEKGVLKEDTSKKGALEKGDNQEERINIMNSNQVSPLIFYKNINIIFVKIFSPKVYKIENLFSLFIKGISPTTKEKSKIKCNSDPVNPIQIWKKREIFLSSKQIVKNANKWLATFSKYISALFA